MWKRQLIAQIKGNIVRQNSITKIDANSMHKQQLITQLKGNTVRQNSITELTLTACGNDN